MRQNDLDIMLREGEGSMLEYKWRAVFRKREIQEESGGWRGECSKRDGFG